MNISVVIPTRDRPKLLEEALQSVVAQAGPDVEVVIVDDASNPPIDARRLRSEFGPSIRLVRNDLPVNVCVARDQGVRASAGELVVHLDDDDCLADGALEIARESFRKFPALEVLFLGVCGFGRYADGFNARQEHGVRRILASAGRDAGFDGIVKFDEKLFQALLAGVPLAFQRLMVRHAAWNEVNDFRRRMYAVSQSDAGTDPLSRVCPLWSESEWSLYSSVLCSTALLDKPLYLQRCAGQGYFSVRETGLESFGAAINIMKHLDRATRGTSEFAPWRRLVREHRSEAHLDRAYFCLGRGDRSRATASVMRALAIAPRWKHFRFCAKIIGSALNRNAS